jgi:hypothetical protein
MVGDWGECDSLVRDLRMVNLAETGDALRRHDAASLKAHEEWRRAMSQLAQFDQVYAKHRDGLLTSVAGMADCTVMAGKELLKKLVLSAELEQIFQRLDAAWGASTSEEEKSKIAALLASRDRNKPCDAEARGFVKECAWHIDTCLESLEECLAKEDFELARAIGQQARRISAAMRDVHNAWPWTDLDSLEESWRQYRNDELMDFEMFKNELLKVAQ